MTRSVTISLFLVAITLIAYRGVSDLGFVDYDDPLYVTDNHQIHGGVTIDAIRWAFTTGRAGNWHPLTWLSHMIDCQVFGRDRPQGHHLTNLGLHVLNTLLLYFALQQMTAAVWKSAMVAALFAVHPLHVESVAWIAERKDVLSTMFWLLHIMAYVQFTRRSGQMWYALSLLLLMFGLMAKPMLVTAPFVLLLLDYWPLRRFDGHSVSVAPEEGSCAHNRRRVWLRLLDEKVPMLVLCVASCFITYLVQQANMIPQPWWHRICIAVTAYVRYIGKTLYPVNLACLYPNRVGMWQVWQVVSAMGLLMAVTALVIIFRHRRYLTVGWLWYLGTLVPVIGIVSVGYHSMADRYMYMPMTGLLIMGVWGLADLAAFFPRSEKAAAVAAAGVLLFCLWLTPQQVAVWQSSFTLFEHALSVTDHNDIMFANLGAAYARQGDIEQAIRVLRKALQINPHNPLTHYNLAVILTDKGSHQEGIDHYQEALHLFPEYVEAHDGLGKALEKTGHVNEAIQHYRRSVDQPRNAEGHLRLGNALAANGQLGEATRAYRKVLQINPSHAMAHANLGAVLHTQGHLAEAVRHCRAAVQINPQNAVALNSLGVVLAAKGELDAAVTLFRQSLKIDPSYQEAKNNLNHTLALRNNAKISGSRE